VEILVVIVGIALIASVIFGVAAVLRALSANSSQTQPIAQTPPIDLDALVSTIRTSVEAEVRRTVSDTQRDAAQRTEEYFKAQADLLEQQTKSLLTPFEGQVRQLAESVSGLRDSYTIEQGTMQQLATQISTLQDSTTSLSNALKSPTARGSWGENQLRNVIQLSGMEPYCDYLEQFTGGEADRNQRPDVVVRLPNGAFLAVDSKAPLAAYQRMQEETDAARKDLELKAHVKAMRDHAKTLANKKYWEQFPSAPDFVVMFIPGEGFVSDALRSDPTLLEESMRSRVLIASPVNLLAVLLAVAKGWQAHSVAEHAEKVASLGAELYDRVDTVLDKVIKLGNGLKTANSAYNEMIGSIESRMLVTLRQFKDLGVVQADDVKRPSALEIAPRQLAAAEIQNQIEE